MGEALTAWALKQTAKAPMAPALSAWATAMQMAPRTQWIPQSTGTGAYGVSVLEQMTASFKQAQGVGFGGYAGTITTSASTGLAALYRSCRVRDSGPLSVTE
jgi:hypothetical protein